MVIDITERIRTRKIKYLNDIKNEQELILNKSENLIKSINNYELIEGDLDSIIEIIDLLEKEVNLLGNKLNECLEYMIKK